jgi:hypothetical protein
MGIARSVKVQTLRQGPRTLSSRRWKCGDVKPKALVDIRGHFTRRAFMAVGCRRRPGPDPFTGGRLSGRELGTSWSYRHSRLPGLKLNIKNVVAECVSVTKNSSQCQAVVYYARSEDITEITSPGLNFEQMPVASSRRHPARAIAAQRGHAVSALPSAADTDIQAKDSMDKTSYQKPQGWLAFNHPRGGIEHKRKASL